MCPIMKYSIATVSVSGALDSKLQAIAAAGFDAVEIFESDFISFDGSASDVANICRDLGLGICALQPFRDFEGMPEPQRTQNFRRVEPKFDLMHKLGTDLLLICSNVAPASLGGIDRAADDLRELGERASAQGLRVGFEALAWGRHVNDYRDAWEIVRRADQKSVGIILDSFHTLAPSLPISAIGAIPGDRIFLVQLADAPQLDLNVLSWSRHFRCMPGQGNLNINDFMQSVVATGYLGPLSLEIFNDQFRSRSAKEVAIDGMRSLVLLKDQANIGRSKKATALGPRSEVRASHSRSAASRQNIQRQSGSREIRRQPVGGLLLDRPQSRNSAQKEARLAIRHHPHRRDRSQTAGLGCQLAPHRLTVPKPELNKVHYEVHVGMLSGRFEPSAFGM